MSADVGEVTETFENELCDVGEANKGWRISCDVGEVTEGLKKGWRMSCDLGKATEGLENELWRR